jgi:2,5-diketo-D-gluconate reductase A
MRDAAAVSLNAARVRSTVSRSASSYAPVSIDDERNLFVAQVPSITLNNGVQIPQLGFGVFKIEPSQTRAATLTALEVGYRHIDTAEMYGNEREVGQAVRDSGIDRSEVFVTSKLNNPFHAHDDAMRAFDETLKTLDLDYLDLFLMHWPLPKIGDFVETWKAMEQMAASGMVRAIGVSNFKPHHLDRVLDEGVVVPAVNQIEVHPFFTQDDVRAFNADHGIVTEAWAPIAKGAVADEPAIQQIAEQIERTPAQVTLRWHLQRGDVVFPKSVTPARVRENFELFDFELDDAQMAAISAVNRDQRIGPDPDE